MGKAKRSNRASGPSAAEGEGKGKGIAPTASMGGSGRSAVIAGLLFAGLAVVVAFSRDETAAPNPGEVAARRRLAGMDQGAPAVYRVEVVNKFPHDPDAFTQGLFYEKEGDRLVESTGLHGESDVRWSELTTGTVTKLAKNQPSDFGEGLVEWKGKLVQLLWQSGKTIIWNATTLEVMEVTSTPLKDGWGLTHDGEHLIASDSGDHLFFLDPETLSLTYKVKVMDQGIEVPWLNELEWIDGEVWANVWQHDCMARIDPQSGRVSSWILAENLAHEARRATHLAKGRRRMDVLNGIAFDKEGGRIFATGKLWPLLFEIKLVPVQQPTAAELDQIRLRCVPGLKHKKKAAGGRML